MSENNLGPEHCPPENEVEFLSFGMDEHGHKLRIFVDGKQKWVRVGFRDVESMYRSQEMQQAGLFDGQSSAILEKY